MTQSGSLPQTAIIGAGVAGITCARHLQQSGQSVILLEKSRGLGGRMATRRLEGTCADHGACYLSSHDEILQPLIQELVAANVIHPWSQGIHTFANGTLTRTDDRAPQYAATQGMSEIAKHLAQGLDIRRNHLVKEIRRTESGQWHLTIAGELSELTVNTLILAIPAPQAIALLSPIAGLDDLITSLKSIYFFPSLSVMALYGHDRRQTWMQDHPEVQAITFTAHPTLGYLGFESSKRPETLYTMMVIQSSAALAEAYLNAIDLQPAGRQILRQAAEYFGAWLADPAEFQVHRWRYAFAVNPLSQTYLSTPDRLFCIGDWCGGRKIEQAVRSGLDGAISALQIPGD